MAKNTYFARYVVTQSGPKTYQVHRLKHGQQSEGTPEYILFCTTPSSVNAHQIATTMNKEAVNERTQA